MISSGEPRGAALTTQGEVIRLAGRICHELLDNGGVNWRLASPGEIPLAEISGEDVVHIDVRTGDLKTRIRRGDDLPL